MNFTKETVVPVLFYVVIALVGGFASYLFALEVSGNPRMELWFIMASVMSAVVFYGAGAAALFYSADIFREPRR